MKKEREHIGLCYRCQRRVDWLERHWGFRYECEHAGTTYSCYGFVPVKPVVLEKNKGDPRSLAVPALIAARAHAVSEADCVLRIRRDNKKLVLFWEPKRKRKKS